MCSVQLISILSPEKWGTVYAKGNPILLNCYNTTDYLSLTENETYTLYIYATNLSENQYLMLTKMLGTKALETQAEFPEQIATDLNSIKNQNTSVSQKDIILTYQVNDIPLVLAIHDQEIGIVFNDINYALTNSGINVAVFHNSLNQFTDAFCINPDDLNTIIRVIN